MDKFRPRWGMSFGLSAAFHCAVLLGIGAVLHFSPLSPPQDIVEVDLVDIGGGGGGGAGPAIETPEAEHPTEEPREAPQAAIPEAEPIPDAENGIHEIRPERASGSAAASRSGGHGNGGSGTGTGDGDGSGSGTGQGSGTGPGSGSGSGGGAGDGETMGPQLLSATKPRYPESARRNNIEGTAVVGLTIGTDGRVSSAWLESSSGNSAMDEAAVEEVYNWRFVPAKRNGAAITVNSRVPVVFQLH